MSKSASHPCGTSAPCSSSNQPQTPFQVQVYSKFKPIGTRVEHHHGRGGGGSRLFFYFCSFWLGFWHVRTCALLSVVHSLLNSWVQFIRPQKQCIYDEFSPSHSFAVLDGFGVLHALMLRYKVLSDRTLSTYLSHSIHCPPISCTDIPTQLAQCVAIYTAVHPMVVNRPSRESVLYLQ